MTDAVSSAFSPALSYAKTSPAGHISQDIESGAVETAAQHHRTHEQCRADIEDLSYLGKRKRDGHMQGFPKDKPNGNQGNLSSPQPQGLSLLLEALGSNRSSQSTADGMATVVKTPASSVTVSLTPKLTSSNEPKSMHGFFPSGRTAAATDQGLRNACSSSLRQEMVAGRPVIDHTCENPRMVSEPGTRMTSRDAMQMPSARSITNSSVGKNGAITAESASVDSWIQGEPRDNDVLCGRGGGVNKHVGNIIYRRVVEHNKPTYKQVPKRHRMMVSQSIVQAILNTGGRFLHQHDGEIIETDYGNGGASKKQTRWKEIPFRKAVQKTSQALRERSEDETAANLTSEQRNPFPATNVKPSF